MITRHYTVDVGELDTPVTVGVDVAASAGELTSFELAESWPGLYSDNPDRATPPELKALALAAARSCAEDDAGDIEEDELAAEREWSVDYQLKARKEGRR